MRIDDEQIKLIAKKYLGVETLKQRGLDRLDFHDLAVWNIKAALDAAYLAGHNDARRSAVALTTGA